MTHDDFELFVGQHGVWRDDVESRVGSSPDPFVQFIWRNFASFSSALNRFLVELQPVKREAFTTFALSHAWADFGNPQTVAGREAFPLEWFTSMLIKTRAGHGAFARTRSKYRGAMRRLAD